MQIELKLNKDFERTLNALRIKYGNDFEILNGVDESQLDYSEFLKNFIKENSLKYQTLYHRELLGFDKKFIRFNIKGFYKRKKFKN